MMKFTVGKKLSVGFGLVLILLVGVAFVGHNTATTISEDADELLLEKVPIVDMAMEARIAIGSGMELLNEFLLCDELEQLPEIRTGFEESVADFDLFMTAVTDGSHDKQGNWTEAFETRKFEGGDFAGQPLKAMWESELGDEVTYGASEAIAEVAGHADELHEDFCSLAEQQMADHEKMLALTTELDGRMEDFDETYGKIDEFLKKYEASLDENNADWKLKDAAMEATISVSKMKAIAEEYGGLKDASMEALISATKMKAVAEEYGGLPIQRDAMRKFSDAPAEAMILSATQKQLTAEFAANAADFLTEAETLPAEIKELFATFRTAGNGTNGILPTKDQALMMAMTTRHRLKTLDEAAERLAVALGADEGGLEHAVGNEMDATMANADETADAGHRNILLIAFGGFFAGIAAAWFTTRAITRPVGKVAGVLEAVAGGDYSQKADVRSNDELG
ncbi:MAG: HAMP domain-containing protein, partial [Planctomycetes bacterium]|nr:HAMP domain-containing protein [Planctomycetota bacterium]